MSCGFSLCNLFIQQSSTSPIFLVSSSSVSCVAKKKETYLKPVLYEPGLLQALNALVEGNPPGSVASEVKDGEGREECFLHQVPIVWL